MSHTLELDQAAHRSLPAGAQHRLEPLGERERHEADQAKAELAALKQWIRRAADVCREAADGNLEPRILEIDGDDDLAQLCHQINHLLDMTDAFLRESVAALQHANQEKFYRRVLLDGMRGGFRQAAESINRTTDDMERTTVALREAEQRRQALAGDFEKTNEVVGELTHASEEIAQISDLITQVASQSNLLALNAAIEAARAGELGAGFGVVASEVKKLSDRTAAATKGIDKKVKAIQAASSHVGKAMRQIWETIQSGKGSRPTSV